MMLEIKELKYLEEQINLIVEIKLKKCKNCGRYFIPHNKQMYCDTCKTIPYDMRKNKNPIYEAYRKTYKTQHNKLKRHIDKGIVDKEELRERFKKWNEIAKNQKNTCKTVEEYNKWYKANLNWEK